MSALDGTAWPKVRPHYDERIQIHRELLSLRKQGNTRQFAALLLGVSNPAGNYSADEHALGPKILSENANAERRVADLAEKFIALKAARDVPRLIRGAQLRYLQIGVGSEASCMLNPDVCWVANTRTIWTHLVIKHADDFAKANEELKLYRNADVTSEMAYQMWSHIHQELAASMTRIAEEGEKLARRAETRPGEIKYLWADAIANALYDDHHKQ
ncbi:MAG: hypothetical protein WA417_17375 [Stellaceae bacterium]